MKKKKEVNDVHAVWDAAKKQKAFRTYAGWRGKPAPPIDDGKPNHWIDHHKTLVYPNGQRVFISEPYSIDNGDLAELAVLAQKGWYVHVDGMSPHFPGWTILIRITRRTLLHTEL